MKSRVLGPRLGVRLRLEQMLEMRPRDNVQAEGKAGEKLELRQG
jgi:hypothetical protein